MVSAKYISVNELAYETPYLVITGELWNARFEYLEKYYCVIKMFDYRHNVTGHYQVARNLRQGDYVP